MRYQPARQGNGRYTTNYDGLDNPERDHLAATMRRNGHSYREIAEKLGWATPAGARQAYIRAIEAVPKEHSVEQRALELIRLDQMYLACMAVLEAEHVVVSNGRLVSRDGVPIKDDAPILQTVDRMLRISESRRRLLGLDAPAKTRVEVVTDDVAQQLVDQLEAEIHRMSDEPSTVDSPQERPS